MPIEWGTELRWFATMAAGKVQSNVPLTAATVSSLAVIAAAAALGPTQPNSDAALSAATSGAVSAKEKERRRLAATHKAGVNKKFFKNVVKLFAIAMPNGARSKQSFTLAVLSVLLVLRTLMSIKVAQLTGTLARRMVQAQVRPFAVAVAHLGAWSVPASLINSGIKWCSTTLQHSFRQNLAHHYHQRYLSQQTFFRCVGLGAVDNVDQRVTQDIQKFADVAAGLYSTLTKPLVDIALFSYMISRTGGWKGPGLIILWYGFVTVVMKSIAPNFAGMTNEQQRAEGAFRAGHTHVVAHAEEVIFAQGEGALLSSLDGLFARAMSQFRYIGYRRAGHSVIEGLLVKYGSVMVGYAICAISAFSPEAAAMSVADLTGLYIHQSRLLMDLAKAVGSLIMTYKTVASLAGFTHRVSELESNLATIERAATSDRRREKAAEQEQLGATPGKKRGSPAAEKTGTFASSGGGNMVIGDSIRFSDVPIVSPDGTTLVKALCFYVQPGMNVLVVGPNGCGKSSTFRLLGELWPLQGGTIEKPSYEHLYYVPQRPYMSSGTLRDQVTYPDKASSLRNVGEARLFDCLKAARVQELLDKPGVSWDARLNWSGDILSMGEKQKLAMARLFFHKPRYAILDECSSGVDLDVEQQVYEECRRQAITLLTIAHRRSVWKFHNWILRFDGDGGYMFSRLAFTEEKADGSGGDIVLTNVVFASDPDVVGARVTVTPQGVDVQKKED
jgi:ABC-type uncharacterized transport system fused permease/ATPase subunit